MVDGGISKNPSSIVFWLMDGTIAQRVQIIWVRYLKNVPVQYEYFQHPYSDKKKKLVWFEYYWNNSCDIFFNIETLWSHAVAQIPAWSYNSVLPSKQWRVVVVF